VSEFGTGAFSLPAGIAVDATGNVYVACGGGNSVVKKYDGDGNFLMQFGTFNPIPGRGDTEFHAVGGIAVDAGGNIYVSDYSSPVTPFCTGPQWVKKFNPDGTFSGTKLGTGGCSNGDGDFMLPRHIAVHGDTIYVAGLVDNRVQRFLSDGTLLPQLTIHGLHPGGSCSGVAVGADGTIYVTDVANNFVDKFAANKTPLASWGGYADCVPECEPQGNGKFRTVMGVDVDANGNVYVADMGNNRVQKFDSDGKFILYWGLQRFRNPGDVAVATNGFIYVLDSGNEKVQKFK
jgi:sugar lactone lactonase YvrE